MLSLVTDRVLSEARQELEEALGSSAAGKTIQRG